MCDGPFPVEMYIMNTVYRVLTLTKIFLLEHAKEPVSFFWVMISPCITFYLISLSRNDASYFKSSYALAASWYYAYIAYSVAMFGFSLYIIGRRESGFVRSFTYTKGSRVVFLIAQTMTYWVVALAYCVTFYLASKPLFGDYDLEELFALTLRFFVCYAIFICPGLIFSTLKLDFQSAHTLLSVMSILMIGLGLTASINASPAALKMNSYNLMSITANLMHGESDGDLALASVLIFSVIASSTIGYVYFRVNPVWSRY